MKELAIEVMNAMDMTGELTYLSPRNEVMHAYSDHSKAKQIFGNYAQNTT